MAISLLLHIGSSGYTGRNANPEWINTVFLIGFVISLIVTLILKRKPAAVAL